MNEAALVIGALLIACVLYGVFLLGRVDGKADLDNVKADLVTERAVRHNLNCLVGDLKFDVSEAHRCRRDTQADALAFNSLKGQWVTDNKHLVEYHIRKECFRRIGYPEERL